MGSKTVSYLLVAISAALLVAANATVTSSDNNVGEEGLLECLADLPKLVACREEIVGFFTKGKVTIGRQCCLAVVTAVGDCLTLVLQQYGIPAGKSDVLTGFCRAAFSPTAAPAPTSTPAPAPAPL